jgi:hypothetical protein
MSPDGKKVLVVRGRDLWSMDADGAVRISLLENASRPDWQPKP